MVLINQSITIAECKFSVAYLLLHTKISVLLALISVIRISLSYLNWSNLLLCMSCLFSLRGNRVLAMMFQKDNQITSQGT